MQTLMLVTLLASIDVTGAQRGFNEMEAMCAADDGRLWGRSLCGPTVFADPQTREAVRNDGTTLKVPDSIGIANTAVDWDGRRWTMVMWPLPQGVIGRRALLAHESFHRIQQELGLPANNPSNAHLDTAEGRTLLRLEWRALARALATGEKSAVEDALAFRAQRRALAANAAEEERLLELNEGLAEHTGYALAVPYARERIAPLVRKLANAEKGESFARSFAYATGPAWGTLLEMKDPRWTRKLKPADDLSELARRTWGIARHPERSEGSRNATAAPFGDPSASARLRMTRYGADVLHAEETARATRKREEAARLRSRFVDGPVLVIPLHEMQFTFDPNNVQPLEGHGTVYPSLEVRDVWGKIVVTRGALMSSDYKRLTVPADGDGYTLTLNEGWKMVPGAREGDKTVSR